MGNAARRTVMMVMSISCALAPCTNCINMGRAHPKHKFKFCLLYSRFTMPLITVYEATQKHFDYIIVGGGVSKFISLHSVQLVIILIYSINRHPVFPWLLASRRTPRSVCWLLRRARATSMIQKSTCRATLAVCLMIPRY